MTGKVPVLSMVFMSVTLVISIAIPVILFIFFRKRKRADILPFFIGCAVMFLFAIVLESLLHQLVLNVLPTGDILRGNILLYALYGGLAAGIFEESGRFLAFKTVLRKKQEKDVNALMYGAGHGGFEAAYLVGSTMANNLILSTMINFGQIDKLIASVPAEAMAQLSAAINQLILTTPETYLISLLERVLAVVLHLALSVFVWFAAKYRRKWPFFPLAIFLHAAVDAAVVLLADRMEKIIAVEVLFAIMVLWVAFAAWITWERNVNGRKPKK